MEKIKNIFKPDVIKEAEARRAADAEKASAEGASSTADQSATMTTPGTDTKLATATGADTTETATETRSAQTGGEGVTQSSDFAQSATSAQSSSAAAASPSHFHDDPVGPGITHGMVASGAAAAPTTESASYALPTRSVGTATTAVPTTASTDHSHTTYTGAHIHPEHPREPEPFYEYGASSTGTGSAAPVEAAAPKTEKSQPTNEQGASSTGVTSAAPALVAAPAATSATSEYDPDKHEHHVERDLRWREQSGGGEFGVLHKHQEPKYQDPADPETTAREKYFGEDHATRHIDPVTGKPAPESERATSQPRTSLDNSAMQSSGEKRTGLSRLFHRDNPNKLHKEPKGGYPTASTTTGSRARASSGATGAAPGTTTTTTAATDSGYNGRENEAGGALSTDASRAPDLGATLDPSNPAYRPSAEDGRVLDPTTGLPMNIANPGAGTGGAGGVGAI